MKVNLKSIVLAVAVVSGVVLVPITASAQSVNQREYNQRHRIVNGVKGGELTRHEAVHLSREEARIHAREYRDRRDGCGYTPAERARNQRQLNRVSRDIYHDTHNNRWR